MNSSCNKSVIESTRSTNLEKKESGIHIRVCLEVLNLQHEDTTFITKAGKREVGALDERGDGGRVVSWTLTTVCNVVN